MEDYVEDELFLLAAQDLSITQRNGDSGDISTPGPFIPAPLQLQASRRPALKACLVQVAPALFALLGTFCHHGWPPLGSK